MTNTYHSGMGGSWKSITCTALALLLSSCSMMQNDSLDLRLNHKLYHDTAYRARLASDKLVFCTPIKDVRANVAVVAAASGPYPITHMPENVWARPLLEMIEDILMDELVASDVFAGVDLSVPPPDEALIFELSLMTLHAAQEERPFGRRTYSDIGIAVRIYGAKQGSKERPIVFERQFGKISSSNVGTSPPMIAKMVGSALRGVLLDMLAAIDQSNIARSGIPNAPMRSAPKKATDKAGAKQSAAKKIVEDSSGVTSAAPSQK